VTIAALTWPATVVWAALIVTTGIVVSVLIWSIFRTGQTAIKSEGSRR
jgi:hypothetical protein